MYKSIKIAITAATLSAAVGSGVTHAAVPAEEASKLGAALTKFGAEAGANADGSIPAYAGGTKAPAGYKSGADRYIDPFRADKPLQTITASNMGQYAALLTEGDKAMLKAMSTYQILVYPTRRSVWYPGWVLDNTVKNATTASLEGQVAGDSMKGGDEGGLPFAGVPFPIPKNGNEVMWNHRLSYGPAVMHQYSKAFLVDSAGKITRLPDPDEYFLRPWYDRSGKLRQQTFNATNGFSAKLMNPPSAAGTHFLNYYLPTAEGGGQKVWFYTPGQRRVRSAPEFSYDIPIAAYGGVLFWDEVYGFTGRQDRFDFKLVGRKEMIVPYNVFGVTNTVPTSESVGPKHLNPQSVRFEKRRVWVVDATRKQGARHAYSRRTFYVEEDCWCLVATESYDNGGKLWRTAKVLTFPTYDTGGVNNMSWNYYDLIKGNYTLINSGHADSGYWVRSYTSGDGLKGMALTPQAVSASSVR